MREPGTADRRGREAEEPLLVVDDDPISCSLTATALELAGFRVQWTTDPLHALDLLRAGRHALLVSDVNMPHMLGTELAAEARKVRPDLHVLLVSAFGDGQVRADAQALGVAILSKPVCLDALTATVRELLHERTEGRAAL